MSSTSSGGDHPRSRGVYREAWTWATKHWGSSPLARGLPGAHARRRVVARIIPARAGFTCAVTLKAERTEDHPRSRGVYAPSTPPGGSRPGSSPLARGLLTTPGESPPAPRIIPARAGFTTAPAVGPGTDPDHPRSRGVYTHAAAPRGGACGSSPLARGLHAADATTADDAGIIPARAGFTRPLLP